MTLSCPEDSVEELKRQVEILKQRNAELETQNRSLKKAFVAYCRLSQNLKKEKTEMTARLWSLSASLWASKHENTHLARIITENQGLEFN